MPTKRTVRCPAEKPGAISAWQIVFVLFSRKTICLNAPMLPLSPIKVSG
jgi:hypothetical protein